MIITLDAAQIGPPAAPCTLGELLEAIRAQQPAERLITRVALNGEALTEANAPALLAGQLAGDDQVDVETGESLGVVADALREVAGALREAAEAAPAVAVRLNTGDVAGGMRDVSELVTVWQNGQLAVSQAGNLLQRDLADSVIEGRRVGEYLQDLITRLTEVRDAMRAGDMVLMADLLHYEMPTLCETWSRVLAGLADDLAAAGSPT